MTTATQQQVRVTQWWRNGDHPDDLTEAGREILAAVGTAEGAVVRYFRHPDVPGDRTDPQCGRTWHDHGWIDAGAQGQSVCPGDLIVDMPDGKHVAVSTRDLTGPAEQVKVRDQLWTQLASIGHLADAAVNDPRGVTVVVEEGDFAWSPAYQAVADLVAELITAKQPDLSNVEGLDLGAARAAAEAGDGVQLRTWVRELADVAEALARHRSSLTRQVEELTALAGTNIMERLLADPQQRPGVLSAFKLVRTDAGAVAFLCEPCRHVGMAGGPADPGQGVPSGFGFNIDQDGLGLDEVVEQALAHHLEEH